MMPRGIKTIVKDMCTGWGFRLSDPSSLLLLQKPIPNPNVFYTKWTKEKW